MATGIRRVLGAGGQPGQDAPAGAPSRTGRAFPGQVESGVGEQEAALRWRGSGRGLRPAGGRHGGASSPAGSCSLARGGVCVASLSLVFHAAPTLIWDGLAAAGFRDANLSVLERWSLVVYEPWFFMGGVLYGAAAWGYGRRLSRPGPAGPDRRCCDVQGGKHMEERMNGFAEG